MKKILIVDDSAFMRNIIKSILLKKGLFKESVEILEADSRQKALEIVRSNSPNLILLDIVMKEGEKEGVQFLREIRRTNTQTPVIMITAIGQSAIIEECETLGILGYLTKPVDEEQLIKVIGRVEG